MRNLFTPRPCVGEIFELEWIGRVRMRPSFRIVFGCHCGEVEDDEREVVEAESESEAMEIIRERFPDAVLLDWRECLDDASTKFIVSYLYRDVEEVLVEALEGKCCLYSGWIEWRFIRCGELREIMDGVN